MIQTQTIHLGDLAFTVDLCGPADGPPVLLLHGFPESRHMWTHQMEALGREGYRAVAPDQRGYSAGARPAETEAYATDRLVADALRLMDVLGAARFDLVGHDWGGQISWLIAAGRRERLRSLTVLSRPHPGAFARAMIEDSAQAARSGHHRAFRTGDAVARMRAAELAPLRQALLDQGVPPPNAEVYITTLLQPGGIEGAMAWYRASGIAAATTPSISTPTLYVWGEDDATVGRRAAELTAEHVSGPYSFVALPGVGHFVVDERPRSVSQLIIDHIASATPGD